MVAPCKYLIALDLDGTSVRYEPRLEMDPGLVAYLASLRSRGVTWAMNSDRLTSTMLHIASLLPPAEKPAAILSCQRYIHLLNGDGSYAPIDTWNSLQEQLHHGLWDRIRDNFPQWQKRVEASFTVRERVINDLVFAFMVPPEETPALRRVMGGFIGPWPEAQISGNHDWTFILHASFSKARVLAKCAELLGVGPDNTIAVGDGINDISMLSDGVARHVGCPANASPEVVNAVRNAGGLISDLADAAGTVQILQQHLGSILRD